MSRQNLALLAAALAWPLACAPMPGESPHQDIESVQQAVTVAPASVNLDGASLDALVKANQPKGLRPISLSAYGTAAAPRFAVVFVQASGPAWKITHGTGATLQAEIDKEASASFKPILMSVDGSGQNVVWAAAFVPRGSTFAFVQTTLVSGDPTSNKTIEYWLQAARDTNMIPTTLAIYGTATAPQYALSIELNTARVDWRVGRPGWSQTFKSPTTEGVNDTAADHQKRVSAQTSGGNRVGLVDLDGANRYVAVFRDDSVGSTLERHDLTESALKTEISTSRSPTARTPTTGLRPFAFATS